MTPAAFERAALALPGAHLKEQWGDDRVFKIGKAPGKMFAVLSGQSAARPSASFKCSRLSFRMLIEKRGIVPAPYMARAGWVMLQSLDALPDAEIEARLIEAHRLVAEKLPKKEREALLR